MFTAGALSIMVQTVLLRELMAVAHGTELTLGFGLAFWLLGGAAGSVLAARLLPRFLGGRGLAVWFLAVAAVALPGLAFVRGFKPLAGYLPGQGMSLGHMALLSLTVMSVVGLAFGALYVFGTRYLEERGHPAPGGAAYWAEAAGCLAGGAAFTFLLAFELNPASAMIVSMGLAIFGATWSFGIKPVRLLGVIAVVLSIALSSPIGLTLENVFLAWGYPGFSVAAVDTSPYGQTMTVERQGQRAVLHNDCSVFHSPVNVTLHHEELAAWGLLHAGRVESTLLIGGAEILPLFSRLGCQTVYAEPDPALLRAIVEAAKYDTGSLFENPGIRLANTDGRALLERSSAEYDLLIISLPPPATVSQNRYYTEEFFKAAARSLRPKGTIILSLPGSQAPLDGHRARLAGSIVAAMRRSFPKVEVIPGETFFLVGLRSASPRSEALLVDRFNELGWSFEFLSDDYIKHRLEEKRAKIAWSDIGVWGANRDYKPRALAPAIMLWQQAFSPSWAKVYDFMVRRAGWLWLVLAAGLLWPRMRQGGAAFTSGAASMGLQALCLWGIQIKSGALYQWLGLGNALFMAGTAAGAWACTIHPGVRSVRIARWELAFAFWSLAFMAGHILLDIPCWVYLICAAVTGTMLGLEFPALVSGRAGERLETESAAAGPIYAWDLAGGVSSALAVGVVLIPAWGMAPTAALLAGLKVISLRWWFFDRGSYV